MHTRGITRNDNEGNTIVLVFILGLVLGTVSGVGTWLGTHDGGLSALVAGIVAVLCWLGVAVVVFIDGEF